MNFEEIKRKAEKELPDLIISRCIDIGEKYAFSFRLENEAPVPPGIPIICVDKNSGEISYMTIPPLTNLDILKNGKEIPLK